MKEGLRNHLPQFLPPAPHHLMVLLSDSGEAKETLVVCLGYCALDYFVNALLFIFFHPTGIEECLILNK